MVILLVDNGSKYLRELEQLLGQYGQVEVSQNKEKLKSTPADLVVLSGGFQYSVLEHPEIYQKEIDFVRKTATPVLGICLGAEIVAYAFGATLEQLEFEEKGLKQIEILKADEIFSGMPNFKVYESHKWAISKLSDNLEALARSKSGFEVVRHITKPIYGFQFHPEMMENQSAGDEIFNNLMRRYLK